MLRPNWFFAFPIAGAFVSDLPKLPANFRLFHPEDVHMTLSFLGGVGEDAARRALAQLDEELARAPVSAFTISLGEVAPMGGSRRGYTALSALLDQGRSDAVACLSRLRDPLTESASGRREKRPPKPHVSIARPRSNVTEAQREAGLAWARALDLKGIQAHLDRIALYTWGEERHSRLFQIVAERRLQCT